MSTPAVPTPKEVQTAIEAAREAWIGAIVMDQTKPVNLEAAKRFQQRNPDCHLLPQAILLEETRKKVNAIVRDQCEANQALADEISQAFARDLFKAPIPGEVPVIRGGRQQTVFVRAITNVYGEGDKLHGTMDTGTRPGNSERWFVKDGHIVIADPDVY